MRWWRVFIDKLSKKEASDPGPGGPRRRTAPRYGYAVKVQVRCQSWPSFLEMFTGDVSEGGLFIPTDQRADPGEHIEIALLLPGELRFQLTGTVVNAGGDGSTDKPSGLGVKLDELSGDDRERFEILLDAAREAQPIPELLARLTPPHGVPTVQPPATAPTPSPRISKVTFASRPRSASTPPPTASSSRPRMPRVGTGEVAALDANSPIVGIDLGTTYTSVAAIQGKKVLILESDDGFKSVPSVVSITRDGEIIVGPEARARIATDPAHTISSPKRLLGRQYDEAEVQTFITQAPYRTTRGPDGTTVVHIWGQQYAVPQVCAFLLSNIKETAERRLGLPIHRAVVSVPISFDDQRIDALHRAARMANLEIAAVIDEPSSAALANRFDPNFGGVVGVYDFGGGTFDFSIVDVSKGDFRVLSTAGDTWLGGDDLDSVLAEAASNQFWREHKVDLRRQAVEWQRLLFACEQAKRQLSSEQTAIIRVPEVLRTAKGMVDLELTIDRDTLARACSAIIQRSLDTCDQALRLLDMRPNQLTTVYLSGGTTYVPAVREAISAHFGVPVRTGVPPQHAVCLGAAIHAAQLQMSYSTTLNSR